MNNEAPLVTIRCLVYNHAPYLRQCLDGFVKQKTNFRFEALIHDDASTDGSADIIREYAEKYPDIIIPLIETENLYSKQDGSFTRSMNLLTRGKYVAFCEGDDYWSDTGKLQEQVDFLEGHPDYSAIFGTAKVVSENGNTILGTYPQGLNKSTLELADLLKRNWVQTCTVMYRWRFYSAPAYEEVLVPGIIPGDWMMLLAHAQTGKVYYEKNRVWGCYRRHKGSMWKGVGAEDSFYVRNGIGHLIFYTHAEKLFGARFEQEKRNMMEDVIFAALNTGNVELLKKAKNQFPELYTDVIAPWSKANRSEKSFVLALRMATTMKKNRTAYKFFRLIYNLFCIFTKN